MADKRISQLDPASAVGTSVVPVSNASGTVTNKVTLADIAALGGGAPAAHKTSHAVGGADAITPPDIGALSFVSVPSSVNDVGSNGQIAIDSNYLYVYADSKWKVIPLVLFGSSITPPPSYAITITQQPTTEFIGTSNNAIFNVEYQVSHAGESDRFWEFSDNGTNWNLLTAEGNISHSSSKNNTTLVVTNNASLTIDWSKYVFGRTYRLRAQAVGAEAVTNVVGTLVISYLVSFVSLPSNKYLGASGANIIYSYTVNDQGQSTPSWEYSDDSGATWNNVTSQGTQSSSSSINTITLNSEVSGSLFVNGANYSSGRKYRLSVQTLNSSATTNPVEVLPCPITDPPLCECGSYADVDSNGCTVYLCNSCSSSSSS